jgi:WD40 repeat protein
MGGVGKTVLAAAVIQDEQIRARFRDGIVWLTLGQTPDVLTLQRRLLAWVAPDKEPPNEFPAGRDALDTALKSRRWLIVLDDVWRQGDLRAFDVADTPSRLLITTRNEEVVRASGAVPHVVEELTPPAARAFLAKAVGLAEQDLPPTAGNVIEECGRLPLALALAGATLASAPEDEELWRDVVAALRAADHEQLQAEFDYPYPHPIAAIQASVDFLPPEHRAAYLQLAIFPEDAPIPLAPLEKLWGIDGLRLRNRVRLFVDRALARRRDEGSVLLHDLQGDFVRKRCPDVPAVHEALLRSYRPDEGAAWIDVVDDYLIDWLPYHLMGSGRGDECRDLLFDFAWLRDKIAARDVLAMIADAGLCPGDAEVERLGRTLRMSAHVLDSDPRQLTAQLLGRLRKEQGNRTARLLDAASHQIAAGVLVPRGGEHLLAVGPLLRTFQGHSGAVSGAAVWAEGTRALSWGGGFGSSDRTLRLWDLESGASRVLEGHSAPVTGAVVWGEGTRALSWAGAFDSSDHTLRLWDLESGASRVLEGHSGPVTGAVVWGEGTRALSWAGQIGSSDPTVRLWDLESGASRVLEGHSGPVTGAVVWAEGKRPHSWSYDRTLRVWDLESRASRVLEGHLDCVTGAVVWGEGTRALSWAGQIGSSDRTLRVWDLESGASRLLKGHSAAVTGAVVWAEGTRALSWCYDEALRLWDLESGASRVLEGHSAAVTGAIVWAEGTRALTWSFDHTIRLWDLATVTSPALEGHNGRVGGVFVWAEGRRALTWSYDRTLRVWDLESRASRVLEGHSGPVTGAAVWAEGTRALSWALAGNDRTLRVWDLKSGTSRVLEGHSDVVSGAVPLAGYARVLSWSRDRTLRLWDLNSFENLARFVGDNPLTCCIVSKEGRAAVAGDSRGRLLWFSLPA